MASAVFTASPLDTNEIRQIIPLGNLNPRGGHVFPTDHAYLDYGGKPGLAVFAPCAGTVIAIRDQSRGDRKIEVRVDEHLSYYLAHLDVEPDVRVGSHVEAGQVLGRTPGRSSLDLGAYDNRVALPGFINRSRYPMPTLQTVSTLALFAEPLRSQLYRKVDREGPDQDGKIDFDQPGRLIGNWFHQSVLIAESMRGESRVWSKQLAFVYDVHRPSAMRISIGGTVAPAGVYDVQPGAPAPETVGPGQGVVAYELFEARARARSADGEESASRRGRLLVQLVGENRLKVEFFPGPTVGDAKQFTSAASIYER